MDGLTSLKLFARVVEVGSFSRAARDLNIAQPTVTKHIAELERSLGARLFNRNTRNVLPTDIGLLYYEKCRNALRELDEGADLVRGGKASLAGTLRISTSIAFGRRVLTPLILEFMAENRDLRIDLSCDDRYVDIVSAGLDCAVRLGQLADSSYGAKALGASPWMMIAAHAYLDARGRPAAPRDLAAHECLVYSTVQGNESWRMIGRDGKAQSVAVTGRLRTNSLSSLLDGARAGMGIAMLPVYVAREGLRDGTLEAVMPDYSLPAQEINLVFPSPKLVPRKVSTLAQFLQKKFQGEWWGK